MHFAPPRSSWRRFILRPPSVHSPLRPQPGESHLTNIRQITFGGENAEAYFSRDGQWLTFQSTRDGHTCDQQYVMRVDGTGLQRVSNGRGKTTCGWFLPDGAATVLRVVARARLDVPAAARIRRRDTSGVSIVSTSTRRTATGPGLRRLTNYNVYTAEGVLSPDGRRIVFTSLKDGDLDIYTMNVDGSDVKRLTTTPGYDGGPWWSPDGTKIVYRAWHPPDSAGLADYQGLLAQRMVRPSRMELWVMNADGSDQTADHQPGRRELRALVDSRRPADRVLVQLQESTQPQLRAVPGQPRWVRTRAGHESRGVRRLPDVQSGWSTDRVGIQSWQLEAGRDEPLHRGLEELTSAQGRRSAALLPREVVRPVQSTIL